MQKKVIDKLIKQKLRFGVLMKLVKRTINYFLLSRLLIYRTQEKTFSSERLNIYAKSSWE